MHYDQQSICRGLNVFSILKGCRAQALQYSRLCRQFALVSIIITNATIWASHSSAPPPHQPHGHLESYPPCFTLSQPTFWWIYPYVSFTLVGTLCEYNILCWVTYEMQGQDEYQTFSWYLTQNQREPKHVSHSAIHKIAYRKNDDNTNLQKIQIK